MRKVIIIGSCAADFIFQTDKPSLPATPTLTAGGRLLNAATILGRQQRNVTFVSEAARDTLGDILIDYISQSGVNTDSIDRYSDGGVTPARLYFHNADDSQPKAIIYNKYPDTPFDTIWPRIDPDDIVVFGSYFAIAPRSRAQVTDIVTNAIQRKATIVYLPGFPLQLTPGITRVMPAILENLELAHIVITRTDDLRTIFGTDDPQRCFNDKIYFYSPLMINTDSHQGNVSVINTHGSCSKPLPADTSDAMHLAAIINALLDLNITTDQLSSLSDDTCRRISDKIALHCGA